MQHAAGVMYGSGNLAALLEFWRVAHIDHESVAFCDHFAGVGGGDRWHRGIGRLNQLFDVI